VVRLRIATLALVLSGSAGCSALGLASFDIAQCNDSADCSAINNRNRVPEDACERFVCEFPRNAMGQPIAGAAGSCVRGIRDDDADGAINPACAREGLLVDCNDGDPTVRSGSAEVCDGADDTDAFFSTLAKDFGIYVIGGNVRQPDALGRNEAAVYAPDGACVVRYHKIHPFSFADEHLHYRGGDEIKLFTAGAFTVAPFICYDLRFPEAFRLAVKQGAQVLVVIANWPAARVGHWLALLTARAIENQCYVIGCNRVGHDPNVAYPGRSQIIDPRGKILVDAGDTPGVASAHLDLDALVAYRKSFPALNDIRLI